MIGHLSDVKLFTDPDQVLFQSEMGLLFYKPRDLHMLMVLVNKALGVLMVIEVCYCLTAYSINIIIFFSIYSISLYNNINLPVTRKEMLSNRC